MTRTEICDFWIGSFENENDYFDFLGEDPHFFEDETDEKFISKFGESQGTRWIDHDFMESGFENSRDPFSEKFRKYSYSDQWIPVLLSMAASFDFERINTVVFITKGRIKNPTSVYDPKFSLIYIGQIEYNI